MQDFVAKPIEPDDLFRVLVQWIPARRGVAAHARPAQATTPTDPLAITEAPEPFPKHIDGIDLAVGLRRMMGKRSRYVALLRGFCTSKANADLDIRRALAADCRQDAQRVAHTVKGLAGQIAAHGLQHEAQALEHALQNADSARELADRLDGFAHALAWQVAAIEQALGAPLANTAVPPNAGALEEAQSVLRQLAQLLAHDDAKAERLIADHTALLQQHFPTAFRELRQAVRDYDFEHALSLLPPEFLPG
jgi:two-component system sensor histidine kinase/response regulator